MLRGDGSKKTKPTISAPSSSATSSASGVERPHILTISDIAGASLGCFWRSFLAAVLHRHAGFVLQGRPAGLAGRWPQLQPLRPGRTRSAAAGKAATGLFQSFNLNVQVRDFALQPARRAAPPCLPQPSGYTADEDADNQKNNDE